MKYRNSRMLLSLGLHGRGPARRDGTNDTGGNTDGGGDGGDDKVGSGTDGDASKTPTITGDVDPERAARTIAAARASEKTAKDAAKAANDRVTAILKAAGLAPDGKEDPTEALKAAAADRDKQATRARETAVELAAYKVAAKPDSGIDVVALLDSRTFQQQTADLDPDAADFDDQVAAAIKAALKANPKLAATPTAGGKAPAKMGADITGSGGGGKQRPAGLGAALAARLSGGK